MTTNCYRAYGKLLINIQSNNQKQHRGCNVCVVVVVVLFWCNCFRHINFICNCVIISDLSQIATSNTSKSNFVFDVWPKRILMNTQNTFYGELTKSSFIYNFSALISTTAVSSGLDHKYICISNNNYRGTQHKRFFLGRSIRAKISG